MLDGRAAQEVERLTFLSGLDIGFGHDCRNNRIALIGHCNRQNSCRRLKRPLDRKQARTTYHYSSRNRMTRCQRLIVRAYKFEIADAVNFVVIGHPGCASAEPDLRPKVKADFAAASVGGTSKCPSSAPLVDRERPLFLRP